MTLDPLLEAPLVIKTHAFAAIAALVLGVIQLLAPKGTMPHKTVGAVWIVLMIVTAASAYFIRRPTTDVSFFAGMTPIHLFIPLTAFGIVGGLYHLISGGSRLKDHARPFIGIFIGGLVVAGALAFFPGRIMHAVAFGP